MLAAVRDVRGHASQKAQRIEEPEGGSPSPESASPPGGIVAAAPGARVVVIGDHGFGKLDVHSGRTRPPTSHDAHAPSTFAAGVPGNLHMDAVAGVIEAEALR